MARLSETEKKQLLEAARPRASKPKAPKPVVLSPRAYIEFATFAAQFDRSKKPMRFAGQQWKL